MKKSTLRIMKFIASIIFLSAFINNSTNAQTIRGKVTNEKSEPVPNITILIKGTTTGATTDDNGDYLIKVPDTSAIIVVN